MPADDLARAAALLASGDWSAAHALVDDDPTPLGAWLHGIVHTLEGDLGNARYWYRQAGRPFPGTDAVHTEIAGVVAAGAARG
jgi:hypothetical protein